MTFEEKLEEVKSMVREETWKMATAEKEHELKQKDYEYAQKLKRKCLSIEEIEDITGLSQEEIKSL